MTKVDKKKESSDISIYILVREYLKKNKSSLHNSR